MLVTLQNIDGSQVYQTTINKGPVYPDGFLYEGKVYLAWRVLPGKGETIYREKVINTLPPNMHVIEELIEG